MEEIYLYVMRNFSHLSAPPRDIRHKITNGLWAMSKRGVLTKVSAGRWKLAAENR